MFSAMKACGLLRYNETSIWSSDTPGRCARDAIADSVSPRLTRYSSAVSLGVDRDGAVSLAIALGGAGARSATPGAGTGAAAVGGKAVLGAGGAETIGEVVAAAGGCAGGALAKAVGGSSNKVYSRTKRPVDQDNSRMTSMNGS